MNIKQYRFQEKWCSDDGRSISLLFQKTNSKYFADFWVENEKENVKTHLSLDNFEGWMAVRAANASGCPSDPTVILLKGKSFEALNSSFLDVWLSLGEHERF